MEKHGNVQYAPLSYIYVNAMKLKKPELIFNIIWDKILKENERSSIFPQSSEDKTLPYLRELSGAVYFLSKKMYYLDKFFEQGSLVVNDVYI